MPVDYLKTAGLLQTRADYQWLISAGPLYIANQLCKIDFALFVGIIGVKFEFIQCD
jgi:hypothetical protein